MRRLLFFSVVVVLTATLAVQALAGSKRHLVYNFTVGVMSDEHAKDAAVQYNGMSAGGGQPVYGTGDTSYRGTASDSGQVVVDYEGVEADGGLVVTVEETARTNRTSAATPCVVYANTNVVCGGSNVNPEEITVLRTLSPKFFDPTLLDANRHWHVTVGRSGVAIDFTASPLGVGLMTINSQRSEKSKGGDSIDATASYTYAYERCLATTLKEYTTERHELGVGQYTNVTIDVTASLVSDSLATTKS